MRRSRDGSGFQFDVLVLHTCGTCDVGGFGDIYMLQNFNQTALIYTLSSIKL